MSIISKQIIEKYDEGPFKCYRIPGIVTTAKDTVLIYYELRSGSGDWSVQNIGLRRSTDAGDTWSDLIMMANHNPDGKATNNPVCIASKSGRVHFFYQTDYRRAFYRYSDDDGITFSEPKEITYVFESYKDEYDWSLYAMGPGHGIEHSDGRLLIPIWLCKGVGNAHTPTVVSVIGSSDGGKTFERGEIIYPCDDIGLSSPNETTIAELSGGSVILNIRNGGNVLYRAISVSNNGLHGFSKPRFDTALSDPKCFGSILNSGKGILFSNCNYKPGELIPKDASSPILTGTWEKQSCLAAFVEPKAVEEYNSFGTRTHLTIRFSDDDAKSWKYYSEIELKCGYSDIAVDNANKYIYCFYEREWVDGTWGVPNSLAFIKMSFPE